MSTTRTIPVSTPTYSRQRPVRHPQYYMKGGDLHLQIRGTLFRVHSYFFDRDSSKFLPPTCPHARNGDCDETAIIVDVDPTKFERLLWVFYNPTYSLYDASIDDWSDILELSHEWSFVQAKRLAIRELQKLYMPTAERIALYLKYDVGCEYLVPLYAELCSRSETIELEEATVIGLPVAIIIFRLREELRVRTSFTPPPPPPPASPLPTGITQADVRERVAVAFGFPIEVAQQQPGVLPAPAQTPGPTSIPTVEQPQQEGEGPGIPGEGVANVVVARARTSTPTPRQRGITLLEAPANTKVCPVEEPMGWGPGVLLLPRVIVLVVIISLQMSS